MPNLATTWVRPRPDPAALQRDALLGLALAAAAAVSVELLRSTRPGVDMGWQGVEGYLWAVAQALVLCVRRRWPVITLVAAAVVFLGCGQRLPMIGMSFVVQICLFMAIFAGWAWSPHRRRVLVVTVVVLTGMFVWLGDLLLTRADAPAGPTDGLLPPMVAQALLVVALNVVYFAGALAWGSAAWRSARQHEQLEVQTARLEAEQAENARRAVADERLRIARDLHDVVAHHVSGIGVHAAGARRMLDRDPSASAEALRTVEGSSRQAVQEMHELVSLLRTADKGGPDTTDSGGHDPRPGFDDLAALVEQAGTPRLTVGHRTVGEPFAVPSTAALSLYRTAQEALANVRRHSVAANAEVVLRYLRDDAGAPMAVEVEVIDDGHPREPATTATPSAGWGHVGIRERAALHRGSTEIGPRPQGGYRVRVRVPVVDAGADADAGVDVDRSAELADGPRP